MKVKSTLTPTSVDMGEGRLSLGSRVGTVSAQLAFGNWAPSSGPESGPEMTSTECPPQRKWHSPTAQKERRNHQGTNTAERGVHNAGGRNGSPATGAPQTDLWALKCLETILRPWSTSGSFLEKEG